MSWLGVPISGTGCGCVENFPGHRYHQWNCHAVPMPPATYVVRIVGVAKAQWEIGGWEQAYSLAQTLRRARPDRWVDVKLDGIVFALLEPQAVAEDTDQLELETA